MAKELVIVESPAKARTLSKILGSRYQVKASLGHVRDLPEKYLGVDVNRGFAPRYVILPEKREVVQELKKIASQASAVYLATDPDREGEAISWHLIQATGIRDIPHYRVVFHEITDKAVREAFRNPRGIDMRLVNAQQARRVLDRLVGYKISPLLWRKVQRGLSAGRVQSVALRLIVEREIEIENFTPREYWSLEAELAKTPPLGENSSFRAKLIGLAGARRKLDIPSREEAEALLAELQPAEYIVDKVTQKQTSRQPVPPFITSTLQQEAWRKLRFSAQYTMSIAQQLYEGLPLGKEGVVGLITYMRTDSTRVAESAIAETREFIKQKYGAEFLPAKFRLFTTKVKAAQEAHEAIRPTSIRREPEQIRAFLSPDQAKLYELIWKRMVASQMAAALLENTTVDVKAENRHTGKAYLLRAASAALRFPGFLLLYSEGKDDEAGEEGKAPLPQLAPGEKLLLRGLFPQQHFTQPPPRYTEATLVKALEEKGIGRPSTYAPIIATIQQRGYVEKNQGQFRPSELGRVVNSLLTRHFPHIIDVGFTAKMEEELDGIARGEQEWISVLRDFYVPFEQSLAQAASQMEKVRWEEVVDESCPQCGRPIVIRMGRYGKFLACSGYPQCQFTRPFVVKTGVNCPHCGKELVVRRNKQKHIFYGCSGYPQCQFLLNHRPLIQPCSQCGGLLVMAGKEKVKCINCDYSGELEKEAIMAEV
jgi:DNA topoisomerase-1